jgi:hypothetical protein
MSGCIVTREVLAARGNRGGAIGPWGNGEGVLAEREECWRSPEGWEVLRMKYACIFLLTLEVSGHLRLR